MHEHLRETSTQLERASERLFVYGSLSPGLVNHHVVAELGGTWRLGWVEGELHEQGWGAAIGFPGLVWRAGAPRVAVHILESAELPRHWDRLDAFEGREYRRVVVPATLDDGGTILGNIYVIRRPPVGEAS